MFGFMRQFAEYDRLKAEELRRQPARVSGGKECKRCGYCCTQRPCDLSAEDVSRIAAFLKMSGNELFAQCLVVDERDSKLVLRPRRLEQDGGRYLSASQTFDTGPCVWFVDAVRPAKTSCRVHGVKPSTAVDTFCGDSEKKYTPPIWTREELLSLGWDGNTDTEIKDD